MSYPRIEAAMLKHEGYSWEPVSSETIDGYKLTSFHIYKLDENGQMLADPSLPPVFFQHGGTQSADIWLD